eukprot:6195880-Pleurochrysis_carterae.AAC.1
MSQSKPSSSNFTRPKRAWLIGTDAIKASLQQACDIVRLNAAPPKLACLVGPCTDEASLVAHGT